VFALRILVAAPEFDNVLDVVRDALDPFLDCLLFQVCPHLNPKTGSSLAMRWSAARSCAALQMWPSWLNHVQVW